MITYHRRAATNRLNRDCLSSSPSVCNVFINAQCHLYSVNSRRAPHAEAERETQQGDGHTRTHAHPHVYFHAYRFSPTFFHTPHAPTPAQHQTGPRVSGDSSLGCGHQHHSPPPSPGAGAWSLTLFRDPHRTPQGQARALAHTHETTTSGTPCRLLHMYMCIVQ